MNKISKAGRTTKKIQKNTKTMKIQNKKNNLTDEKVKEKKEKKSNITISEEKENKQPNISKVKQKINNLENKDVNALILNLEVKHSGRGRKKKQNTSIPKPQEAEESINKILNNPNSVDYLIKNVSKRTIEVLSLLINPMIDEQMAFQLDMKINAIRRILNILQGYGLTTYYVAKNSNGWLSFAWYINTSKIDSFFDYIKQGTDTFIKDDCNDYFICKKCYKDNNLILTFSEAFDTEFKCTVCGKQYSRLDKTETRELIKE